MLQIDNLEAFVKFCKAYGVKENFLFNATEFYEGRNTGLLLTCITQLGTMVSVLKKKREMFRPCPHWTRREKRSKLGCNI